MCFQPFLRLLALILILTTLFLPGHAIAAECTVNINTDPAEVLADCLEGIGPAKAEAIVQDREANGSYRTVDELTRVGGIGPATVERNRDRIRLEASGQPHAPTPPPSSTEGPGTTVTLTSWNVRNLSSNSRSDVELGLIALLLFRFDFIALQEVLDAEVIFRLQEILQKDFDVIYQMQVSDAVGHNKKERYAFLWREGVIAQPSPATLYLDPGDKFEREPYYGRFRAGTFDFLICPVHILFGDSESDRRPEIQTLDDVYQHFKGQNNEADVIICGDFNFDPTDQGFSELLNLGNMRFAIAPPAKTTIGDRSLYDNCFWSQDSAEIIADSGQVLEFDELMFPLDSRKLINRLISDHRPISVTVKPPQSDDD